MALPVRTGRLRGLGGDLVEMQIDLAEAGDPAQRFPFGDADMPLVALDQPVLARAISTRLTWTAVRPVASASCSCVIGSS